MAQLGNYQQAAVIKSIPSEWARALNFFGIFVTGSDSPAPLSASRRTLANIVLFTIIMKLIKIAFLLFTINLSAQTNKDLFITYDDNDLKNRLISSDKNSTVEIFQFSIQTKSPYEYVLGFNKAGNVEIQTLITAMNFPTFRFTYLNENNNNPEKSISEKDVKNILEFSEIKKLTDAENFLNTLNGFENIYFVDLSGRKSKFTAKKVKFEQIPGL